MFPFLKLEPELLVCLFQLSQKLFNGFLHSWNPLIVVEMKDKKLSMAAMFVDLDVMSQKRSLGIWGHSCNLPSKWPVQKGRIYPILREVFV